MTIFSKELLLYYKFIILIRACRLRLRRPVIYYFSTHNPIIKLPKIIYEKLLVFICRLQHNYVRFRMKLHSAQNEAWFCSEWSVVLLKMKRGFVQNEAWFCSKWSVVFIREKLRTRDRLVTDSWQACHGLMTGLSWTHDRLVMDSRQACHELVAGLSWTRGKLPTKSNNEYINWKGTSFLKNKILDLIIKDFWLVFLYFYFLLDTNKSNYIFQDNGTAPTELKISIPDYCY